MRRILRYAVRGAIVGSVIGLSSAGYAIKNAYDEEAEFLGTSGHSHILSRKLLDNPEQVIKIHVLNYGILGIIIGTTLAIGKNLYEMRYNKQVSR
ncbi:MAG: hypothetical protein HYW24_03490 [Candidatus Aenigmarchaeota archaeon]|nr:hypothetical protein [Candidatus Aenigmarchaeota archaeon]